MGGKLSPEDDGGENATFFKSEKAPIDFDALREAELEMVQENVTLSADEAAPVDVKEFVEGKLPEDDTEKHEAIFFEQGDEQVEDVEDVEDVDSEMIQEGDFPKEEKPEYATGELPPLKLDE